jgi:hypothetical protein
MSKFKFLVAGALMTGGAAFAFPTDVAFDGYCDGMHLVSDGLGHVIGNSTGCVTDPVFGYDGKVKTKGKGVVVDAAYAAGLIWNLTNSGTFEIYAADGTFINAGTWTAGIPPLAPQGARPAAQK